MATGIAPQDTGPSRKPTAGKGRGVQPAGKFVEFDKYIDGQLRRTRGQVKMTEVAVGLMTLCVAVLLFFLAIALLDHWVIHRGFSGFERFFLFAALIGGSGYYFVRYIVPAMLGRVNPIYAAHTIERSKPSLKNSLINFLLFRQKPDTVHGVVFRAMEEQAATGLSRVPIESAVDRTRLIHLGYVLIGCVMALALYFVFSPKNPLVSAHRVLMPWADVAAPSRVTISDIQPRDASAFRGQPVQVSADIEGLSGDEEAKLIYTTADGQVVDRAVALTAPQGSRHLGQMPDGKDGLQQDVSYRIEAGDAQSGTYHIKLIDAPTIIVDSVEYKFPEYTGNPQKTDPHGDLKAIEGTQVTIHATANQPIKTATVDFNCDGKNTSPMKVSGQTATFTFNLTLNEARTGPQFDSYQLRMVNDRKTENPQPIKHRITVLPDLPPEVNFMAPEREEVMVPLDGQVSLELRAIDPDFALTAVRVRGKTERGNVFDQSLLPDAPHSGGFVGKYQFAPAQFGLKEGDIVRYQAVATDNKTPTANETVTPDRRIKIGAAENRNPQQQPNNAAQSDKPNNGQQQPRPNDRNNPPRQGNPQNNSQSKDNRTPEKGQQNDAAQPPNNDQKNNDPKNNGQDKDPNSNPSSNPNGGEQPKNNDQPQPGDDKQQPQNNGQPDNKNPQQGNEQKQNDPKQKDQKQPDSKPSDNGGQKNDPQQKKQDNSQGKSDQSQSKSDKQQNGSEKQQGNSTGDSSQGKGGEKSQSQNGGKDSQQNGASDASQSGSGNANQSSGGNSPPNGNNNPQPAGNDPSQNNQNQTGANQSTSPNQQANPNPQGNDAGGKAQQNPGNGQRANDKGPKTNDRPPADQSPVPADGSDDGRGVERILDHNKPQSPQNNAKPGNSDKNNSAGEQPSGEKNGSDKSGTEKKPGGEKNSSEKSDEKSGGDKTNGEKPGGEKPDADKSGGDKNSGDKSANSQNGADPKTGAKGEQQPNGQHPDGQQPGPNQNQSPGGSKSDDPKSSPQPKPADGTNPADKTPSGKSPGDKPPTDKKPPDNPPTSGNPGDKQEKSNDGSAGNPSKQQKTDPNQNPTPQSPSASSSNSNGNAGAGQDNKDGKGSPDQQQDMKGREKQPGDASKAGEPPNNDGQSPSISKQESNSKGEEDGDRSGGGKSGGGQKANQPGKGQPGQNTPSDEGAGKSNEPGKGENSNQPGGQQKSDHPTGQQGGEKGNGSSSPPAGNPKGDPGQGAKGEQPPNNQNPKSNDPGQQPGSKGQGTDGKGQQSSGGKQSNTGGVQGSGQNTGDQVPDKPGDNLQSGEAPPVDDPNLSYAKKATELAIDRLKSALKNDKQGDNLLHDLGWSRDETEQFIRRQEERLQNADRPNPEDPLRRQAEDALRSLGLRPDRAIRAKGGVTSDAMRGMSSGRQSAPPPDYAEQFKEYNRALNSSGQSGK